LQVLQLIIETNVQLVFVQQRYHKGCQSWEQGRRQKNFQGQWNGKGMEEDNGKETRPKNSTIKPSSTLSVSCMQIQGAWPPCPSADAYA